jgi:hypothetical protein
MAAEQLTAIIKTRVPQWMKEALEALAADRCLDASDIHRAAFRDYLAATPRTGEPAQTAERNLHQIKRDGHKRHATK